MMNILKNDVKKVFFIGIGGISMSALARLIHSFGVEIAGSDMSANDQIKSIKDICKKIYIGHSESNILEYTPDLVVYTGAIKDNNPELKMARELGIPTMERSEFLGLICDVYQNVIAISGTHGKTSTTAMISNIFVCAGLNPTVHIGGVSVNFESNLVVGGRDYFITEACEYKRSFEYIRSKCAVVTNIECDHMDCYSSLKDLEKSFIKFLNNSQIGVVESDSTLLKSIDTKLYYTVGPNGANFEAKDIVKVDGGYKFTVYENGEFLANFRLNIMGEYNIKNALVSIAVARVFGIDILSIYDGLNSYAGVERRNEKIGQIDGTLVYADYCHHPTEIANSLANFKENFGRVLCIFQPHTYTRTVALFKDFCGCFGDAKKVVIYKTYAAREEYKFEGSETYLYGKIKHKNKQLCIDEKELINIVKSEAKNYDVVAILGAGDMYNIVKNGI